MKEAKQKLMRSSIPNYPVSTETETDKLIRSISEGTTQTSISKSDEVTVMQSMLNDKEFQIAQFDRNKGYLGTHSPREIALGIVNDALCNVTGMSQKEATELSRDYHFSKRDASRQITICKDFVGTYMGTGRKMLMMSDPRGEASINLKYVEPHEKTVPDSNASGKTKKVMTPERIKLVSSNRTMK